MRSLAAFLDLYRRERQAGHASASTLQQIDRTLPLFFEHLHKRRVRDVRRIREADVVAFMVGLGRRKTRAGAPLKPSTRAHALSAVHRFCAWLHARGMILLDPGAGVPLPKVERLPRGVLSESSVRRLMSAPWLHSLLAERNRAILELLYGTGLRLAECARLDLMDVDLAQGTVLVRNGKGRKDRVVPLVGRAAATLDLYLREGRPALLREGDDDRSLFVSIRGRRVGAAQIGLMLRQLGRSLGLRATPHALRHACATHLLKGGADVRHVQELLGHKNLDTTALYTRVEISDLKEVLDRAWPHPRRKR